MPTCHGNKCQHNFVFCLERKDIVQGFNKMVKYKLWISLECTQIYALRLYSYHSPFSHRSMSSGFQPARGIHSGPALLHLFYYLQSKMYFVTATGGWIQRIQILQSSVSSPSFTPVLKPGPRCADDQMDLWCNLCKPFAPRELENQRQDFRMALVRRLSSLCYLIANVHRLFSFTCPTFFPVFAAFLLSSAIVITPQNDTLSVKVVLPLLPTCSYSMSYVFWNVTRIGCAKQPHVKLVTICSPIFPSNLWIKPMGGKIPHWLSSILSKMIYFGLSV